MEADRRALLIATGRYSDSTLAQLRAPAGDARALAEVLADPSIGGFKVGEPLIDRQSIEVKQHLEAFFDVARPRDVLLVYLSGHGVLGKDRQLYFAASDTSVDHLRSTGIDQTFLNGVMAQCRARTIVLVLDCCHSGAFVKGLISKGADRVDSEQRFTGQGLVVLTASDALEYAFEEIDGESDVHDRGALPPGSVFTSCLVEGLKSGDADVDGDGRILLDELYQYVFRAVKQRLAGQTPHRGGGGFGDILIARNLRALSASLPLELVALLGSPNVDARLGAVDWLSRLTSAPGKLGDAARQELAKLVDDDSKQVSETAQTVLARSPDPRSSASVAGRSEGGEQATEREGARAPSSEQAPPVRQFRDRLAKAYPDVAAAVGDALADASVQDLLARIGLGEDAAEEALAGAALHAIKQIRSTAHAEQQALDAAKRALADAEREATESVIRGSPPIMAAVAELRDELPKIKRERENGRKEAEEYQDRVTGFRSQKELIKAKWPTSAAADREALKVKVDSLLAELGVPKTAVVRRRGRAKLPWLRAAYGDDVGEVLEYAYQYAVQLLQSRRVAAIDLHTGVLRAELELESLETQAAATVARDRTRYPQLVAAQRAVEAAARRVREVMKEQGILPRCKEWLTSSGQ